MSKQYLTTAAHDKAHPSPIFSLASTADHLISASGSSALQVHSATTSAFPHVQTLGGAHKLGAHHVAAAHDGSRVVSVGFAGEVVVWHFDPAAAAKSAQPNDSAPPGAWVEAGRIATSTSGRKSGSASCVWAVALSAAGDWLAGTTPDGRIEVWDLRAADASEWTQRQSMETKGRFGLSVDVSSGESSMTVSGHDGGGIYVFDNANGGRLRHALPSLGGRAVRTVKFSPAGTLVAASGDAGVVGVYDAAHGEQVAALTGHGSWVMALDWSAGAGEYIVTGDYSGKVRVWRTETKECVSVMAVEEAEGAVWSVCWLRGGGTGAGTARRPDGFVVGTEGGGLRFLREAAGG